MIYLALKQVALLFHSPASNCFSSYPLPSKNETEARTLPFTVFVGLNLDFYSILRFLYVFIKFHQHIFEAYNTCVKLCEFEIM